MMGLPHFAIFCVQFVMVHMCLNVFIQIQEEANKAHEMAVTSLEDTVRSLEQKCTDSEENNVNLKKQVEELRQLEKEYVKNLNKEGYHKSTQTTFDSSLKGNDGRSLPSFLHQFVFCRCLPVIYK